MWSNPQETADLVTFTEEIFNGKLHYLCSVHLKTKFNVNLNPLLPGVPFLYPLKTSENHRFLMLSGGIRREHQARNQNYVTPKSHQNGSHNLNWYWHCSVERSNQIKTPHCSMDIQSKFNIHKLKEQFTS